jgi:uracil-DNA glycosylase
MTQSAQLTKTPIASPVSSQMSVTPGPSYKPCIKPRGSRPAKIMILGEAPGQTEETLGIPFVGASGQELDRMIREAGLSPGDLFWTNVFHTRPNGNQIEQFFTTPKDAQRLACGSPPGSFPPIRLNNRVMHLHPALAPEWHRLEAEINEVKPNLILALGNTALWRCAGTGGIASLRGTCLLSSTISHRPTKVLPSYHPAAVLRQWDLRPIVISDLMKAKIQGEFSEIRRPARSILINPTLADVDDFALNLRRDGKCQLLSVDVETRREQITEIAFAPSPSEALVIPFIRGFKDHYWESPADEVEALRLVKLILQSPVPKLFQNGLYDIQRIWRQWRFAPRNCLHDTMLRHHSELPELQKGLGFLGSIYTEEPAWKLMRRNKDTSQKRDDE